MGRANFCNLASPVRLCAQGVLHRWWKTCLAMRLLYCSSLLGKSAKAITCLSRAPSLSKFVSWEAVQFSDCFENVFQLKRHAIPANDQRKSILKSVELLTYQPSRCKCNVRAWMLLCSFSSWLNTFVLNGSHWNQKWRMRRAFGESCSFVRSCEFFTRTGLLKFLQVFSYSRQFWIHRASNNLSRTNILTPC